ncbi:MAG TPA: hypothetical protein VNB23_02055, partial [Ramlibacter sp.]|nr:hypothetical protein [Ramlibacter sp.]
MLAPELLRDLHVDAHAHPRGQAHLSSASALVIAEGHLCFVADDEHHLGVLALAADPGSAVRLLRIAAGDLPAAAVARKRRKPDLEALVAFPAGVLARRSCLLALGSGSRPGRERGFLVEVGPGMTPGHVR